MGEELTNENSVICQYCNKPYFSFLWNAHFAVSIEMMVI